MTVSSTVRLAGPYAGTGAAATIPFAFTALYASQLYLVRDDGLVLTNGSDFIASVNANQDVSPGGSITVTAAAYVTGHNFWLTTQTALTQNSEFPQYGPWLPSVVETALDKLTIAMQELKATLPTQLPGVAPSLPGRIVLQTAANVLSPNCRYGVKSGIGPLAPVLPPLSSVNSGAEIEIQDIDFEAFTNNQVVSASGADTIVYQDQAGSSTFAMNENGVCLRFTANSTYWRVMYYGG